MIRSIVWILILTALAISFNRGEVNALEQSEVEKDTQTDPDSESEFKLNLDGSGLEDRVREALLKTMKKTNLNEILKSKDKKAVMTKVLENMDWDKLGLGLGINSEFLKMAINMYGSQEEQNEVKEDKENEKVNNQDKKEIPKQIPKQVPLKVKVRQVDEVKEKTQEPIPQIDLKSLDMSSLMKNLGGLMNLEDSLAQIDKVTKGLDDIKKIRQDIAPELKTCLANNGYPYTPSDTEHCAERFPYVCEDPEVHFTCNRALNEKRRHDILIKTQRLKSHITMAQEMFNSFASIAKSFDTKQLLRDVQRIPTISLNLKPIKRQK